MGSGSAGDSLTTGNTGWRRRSWGGRARQYVPWLTQASTTKGPRCRWDSLDDGLLVVMLLPSSQTLSPGANTRQAHVGSCSTWHTHLLPL
jgi:hypothetical protein